MNPARPAPPTHPDAPRGEELLAHGRFLRGLARALVGDPERAEDLLQDTLATAIAHPPRDASAPRAWLAQVLRSLAIKRGRREGERPAREAAAARARAQLDVADPPALLAEIELARKLLEAVERLREPYRATLYLRYWRGLQPQHIAAQERLPVKTVKTRLARGLELLRGELDRRPGGREAWVVLLLPLARSAPPAPLAEVPGPFGLAVPALALGALLVATGLGAAWFALRSPGEPLPLAGGPAPDSEERVPVLVPGATAAGAREAAVPERPPAEAPRGVRISGSVLDEEGRGLAGVEVRAVILASELRGSAGRRYGDPSEAGGADASAESVTASDAQGAFALELAHAGLARVAFELDGRAPRSRRLFVARGQALTLDPTVLARGVALDGTVVDPVGAPVANAELWLAREDEGLVSAGHAAAEPWLARAGTSDAAGRFHLARVAAGDWRLEARAPGFAPGRAEGDLDPTGPEAERGPLVLTLERSASLAGRVLGLEPEELSRARVLARAVAGPRAVDGAERPSTARVASLDERGAFALEGLAPGEECELVVVESDGPGTSLRSEPLRARAGTGPVELFARPTEDMVRPEAVRLARAPRPAEPVAGTLVVLARAGDGSPAAGALIARRDGQRHPFESSEVRAADEAGRLEWTGLAAGEHAFRVVSGVFGPEEEGGVPWVTCTLQAGAAAELELASGERADVHGAVRVAGRALSVARVGLRPEADRAGRSPAGELSVRTDAEGRFAFFGLPVGNYVLEVSHPDRAQSERRALVLGEGGAELRVELADARLAGRVLDPAGRPVAGARVRVQAGRGASFGRAARSGEVLTDELGRFELVGVDPEQPVRLVASAEGLATLQREARWPADKLELVLTPEVPLALALEGQTRPFLALLAEGPRGERLDFGVQGGRETTLRGLGPGSWRLTLRVPRGWTEEALATQEVELIAGEPRTLHWTLP